MAPHFDFVAIGSGPAGQRAAVQAAKLGKSVAVVERRRIVGGVCIETGTIPSKTFREAVLGFARPNSRFYGPRPNADDRPTAEKLLARVVDVVQIEAALVEDQLYRNDVKVLHGSARFLDPHTLQIGADETPVTLTADKVLIAVG